MTSITNYVISSKLSIKLINSLPFSVGTTPSGTDSIPSATHYFVKDGFSFILLLISRYWRSFLFMCDILLIIGSCCLNNIPRWLCHGLVSGGTSLKFVKRATISDCSPCLIGNCSDRAIVRVVYTPRGGRRQRSCSFVSRTIYFIVVNFHSDIFLILGVYYIIKINQCTYSHVPIVIVSAVFHCDFKKVKACYFVNVRLGDLSADTNVSDESIASIFRIICLVRPFFDYFVFLFWNDWNYYDDDYYYSH
jgi:hypothetical protein